jgi:hypothetical protein
MVQWNVKGYVAGSILIQTDRGEGCQIEMKESCVCGGVQMKLGAASRHLVGGMDWSLRAIAKSVGVSAASVVRGLR